jgi:Fur family ferric uptake transcriptional regulator
VGVSTAWKDEAQAQLRRAGHRAGPARGRLLDVLEERTCCASAAELHAAVVGSGAVIGLASVYRALDVLFENGLLQRVDVGDGTARFEPVSASGAHHHHLVCNDCGRIEPFYDAVLERSIERVEAVSGYEVSAHDVVLRGACGDCRGAVL